MMVSQDSFDYQVDEVRAAEHREEDGEGATSRNTYTTLRTHRDHSAAGSTGLCREATRPDF